MEEIVCRRETNDLKVIFHPHVRTVISPRIETLMSKEYYINDITFQVRVTLCESVGNTALGVLQREITNLLFVRFTESNENSYMYKLSSVVLEKQEVFTSGDSHWRLFHENYEPECSFDVCLEVELVPNNELVPNKARFAELHDESILTDFTFDGEDGSIEVHSTVIAVASEPLKRMLEGTWSEVSNRTMKFPGSTKKTLQNLKDFIYLGSIPEDGLKELLLLAHLYEIEDLERKCVAKIISTVNEENAMAVSRFAIEKRMDKLYVELLKRVKKGMIDPMKICLE